MSEDDRAFWAYVREEERPTGMAGRQESDEEEEEEGEEETDSEGEMYDWAI